jgi:hypothetical protein
MKRAAELKNFAVLRRSLNHISSVKWNPRAAYLIKRSWKSGNYMCTVSAYDVLTQSYHRETPTISKQSYVCMYVRTYVCMLTYARVNACINMCVHICIYMWIYLCICIWVYLRMFECEYRQRSNSLWRCAFWRCLSAFPRNAGYRLQNNTVSQPKWPQTSSTPSEPHLSSLQDYILSVEIRHASPGTQTNNGPLTKYTTIYVNGETLPTTWPMNWFRCLSIYVFLT